VKRFLPLIIFASLCVFLVIGLQLNPKEVPSPLIGKPTPVFELPVLDKTNTQFSPEQMRGQVWLLNVWASWCVSCRDEHPLLVEMAKQKLVPIIGLNYKDKDPLAIEWLSKMGDPYQLSIVDKLGNVGINYGVYGVPETFVIDKNGIIKYKFTGPLTTTAVQKELLPLLAKLNQ
jgi:cytochrome c biogenesis protein CcmG/thiol:disulfide interchange protein DsbE